jgi:Fe-S-cluster containining protein
MTLTPTSAYDPLKLSRAYASREGAPVIDSVDRNIFRHRFFSRCLSCTYCGHSCCHWGVDIDAPNVERLRARKDELEAYLGGHFEDWFTWEWEPTPDYPGGKATRTRVVKGACTFQNRDTGACRLHAFALEKGFDYHEIKPLISSLFPLTFGEGLLCLSEELYEGSLACMGAGPSVYDAQRSELLHYFGAECVVELDAIRDGLTAQAA